MSDKGKYVVLNPTEGPIGVEIPLVTRLHSFDGIKLGILNNGKRNSDVFLKGLLQGIKEKYKIQDVIWIDKVNGSKPIEDETIHRLKECRAIITGVGD